LSRGLDGLRPLPPLVPYNGPVRAAHEPAAHSSLILYIDPVRAVHEPAAHGSLILYIDPVRGARGPDGPRPAYSILHLLLVASVM
jgi:hypothetical protein